MKKIYLALLVLLGISAFSQRPAPCATDALYNELIRSNPGIKEEHDSFNAHLRDIQSTATIPPSGSITIPVVFYIVYDGNPANDISNQQINSQLAAMNNRFLGTGIKFCMATKGNNAATFPLKNATDVLSMDGAVHVNNASLMNLQLSQVSSLVNTAHESITKERYLRIWVVKTINGANSGVLGYGTYPNSSNLFDGVVVRSDVFGTTGSLLPDYTQGETAVHEIGHYLFLNHTFEGGCVTNYSDCLLDGDHVCDTPASGAANFSCTVMNSCPETPAVNDDVTNFMDYGSDTCMNHFTTGQTERMLNTLSSYRNMLISSQNLAYTGVCGSENLLYAIITPGNYSPCAGSTPLTFSAQAATGGTVTYAWNFGDADATASNPNTGTGLNVSHKYLSANYSPYTVTLTVTRILNGVTTVATATEKIYITVCAPVAAIDSFWYVSGANGLKFNTATGVAAFDGSIPFANDGNYSVSQQCDASGSLLFYTNKKKIWNKTHAVIYENPNVESGSNDKSVLILKKPVINSKFYYVFTNTNSGNDLNTYQGFHYNIVNTTSSTNPTMVTPLNVPVTVPATYGFLNSADGAVKGGGGLSAVPKCNGLDYWIMTPLKTSTTAYIAVFSFTQSGANTVVNYESRIQLPVTTDTYVLEVSPDGNKVFAYSGNPYFPNASVLFDFDKLTGQLSNPVAINTSIIPNATFSPNSSLLYTTENRTQLYQYNLAVADINSSKTLIATAPYPSDNHLRQLQIAPNGKIYVNHGATSFFPGYNDLYVIHSPNNPALPTNSQSCNFSINGPKTANASFLLGTGLPNLVDAKIATAYPATASISSNSVGCNAFKFFANSCAGPFSWTFGDGSTGVTENTPTHTFPEGNGTYVVRLFNATGAQIATQNIIINNQAPIISGSTQACTDGTGSALTTNTTVIMPGDNVTWSVIGGSGTISGPANQSSVNISWSVLPGTIQLTYNYGFGCSTTLEKVITSSCAVNSTGANDIVYSSAIVSDKTFIGGSFTSYNNTPVNRIARLNANLSLDATFNPGSGADDTVNAIVTHSGGVIIGGAFNTVNGVATRGLAFLSDNGTLDTSFFGAGLNSSGVVRAIVKQSDGRILIGGTFTSYKGVPCSNLIRVYDNGTLDPIFSPNLPSNKEVYTIATQSNGKVLIGGNNYISRLQYVDGANDATFNSGVFGPLSSVFVIRTLTNDRFYVGGRFTTYNGATNKYFMKLTADGNIDTTFVTDEIGITGNATEGVLAIGIQADDKVIIGGSFYLIVNSGTGYDRNGVARLNANGTLDLSYSPGTGFTYPVVSRGQRMGVIRTLQLQANNKILTGGGFEFYNGVSVNNLTRISTLLPNTVGRQPVEGNQNSDILQIIRVYPNPITQYLTIESDMDTDRFELYNTLGQLVQQDKLNGKQNIIDMKVLASGTYYLKVFNDNLLLKSQWIIKK